MAIDLRYSLEQKTYFGFGKLEQGLWLSCY